MAKITIGETTFETCKAFIRNGKDGKTYLVEIFPDEMYTNKNGDCLVVVRNKAGHEFYHKITRDQIINAFKITTSGKNGTYCRVVRDPGGNESLEMRMLKASYER